MNKHAKPEYDYWDSRRGFIRTRKGGWEIGKAVHNHGYSMMEDLVGGASYFQVLVLNTTGRLPSRKLADWLEALFICLSWPDARIWCNQIGSLSGTLRTSPVAAVCAGILAADSRMYGPGTLSAAADFITSALERHLAGESVKQIVETAPRHRDRPIPNIVGYARPLATGDERIAAMERVSRELGFETGRHLALAYEVERCLLETYQEGMNLAGYCVAFLTDEGYSATEIYRLLSTWVSSGVHACFAEAADSPAEGFFPLRCEDVEYRGEADRPVPEVP